MNEGPSWSFPTTFLPPEPPEVTDRGLGRVLMQSKPAPRALALFIVGIAGMVLWLCLVGGLLLFSGREAIVSVVIVTVLLLPASALLARWAYEKGMLSITIHENGLVRRDATGTAHLRWTEIAGIYERAWIHRGEMGPEKRGSFTFIGKDQRIVVDAALAEWRELGRAAREYAEAALFDAYERATDEKRALPFGAFTLDATGIETPAGRFPWNEIAMLRMERKGLDGFWLVQRGGYAEVCRVPTWQVANQRLLLGVLAKNGKLDGIEIAVKAELEAMIDEATND